MNLRLFLAFTSMSLFFSIDVFSYSLNPLITSELAKRVNGPTLLTNDGLFMFRSRVSDQEIKIYSLNMESLVTHELFSYNPTQYYSPNFDGSWYELASGNVILILTNNDENNPQAQFYQSNGVSPFLPIAEPLNPTSIFNYSAVKNGFYYHKSAADLLVTDGQSSVLHRLVGVEYPLCVFDLNHFISFEWVDNRGVFFKFMDGVKTPLFTGIDFSSVTWASQNSTSCMVKIELDTNNFQQLFYSVTEGETITNRNDDFFIKMGDHYLAKTNSDGVLSSPKLVKLDENLTEIASSGLNQQYNNSVQIKPNGNGLWLFNTNSSGTQFYYYDANLNADLDTLRQFNSSSFNFWSMAETDVLIADNEIQVFQNSEYQGNLLNNLANPYQIISSLNQQHFVMVSEDVFTLDEVPKINDRINGPWFNFNYQSQGLSINPGQRSDGSHYIFLSYYLFRAGAPLWLAGVSDYIPGQEQITIELSEFSGADYLDSTSTPESEVLGSLKLNFESCDSMTGSLMLADSQTSILFSRIDDISFQSRCFNHE